MGATSRALGTLVAVLAAAKGCDNGATGVDACRRIEDKRCQLVLGCPGVPVTDEDEVLACQNFYRDQCLFGVADGISPDNPQVEACLDALDRARRCQDAGTPIGSCADAPALAETLDPATTGCSLVLLPEKLAGCGFLRPAPPAPETTATTGGGSG
jgi:hypothetical protein